MYRRRRFKGTWFPLLGEFNQQESDVHDVVPVRFALFGLSSVAHVTNVFPVIYDVPQDDDSQAPGTKGLNEIVGNEYALRRIVGKVHIQRLLNSPGGQFPATNIDDGQPIVVGAGFFIARCDISEGAANADTPVGGAGGFGSTADAGQRNLYSPLDVSTTREPWIWRRTWVLGNSQTQSVNAVRRGLGHFSASNDIFASSSLDGSHIDAKTRRTVRQEERLFFAVSMVRFVDYDGPLAGLDPGGLNGEEIRGMLDIRVFGQIRRARQRGIF